MIALITLFSLPQVYASEGSIRKLEHEVAKLRDKVELLNFKNSGLQNELQMRQAEQEKTRKAKKRLEAKVKELQDQLTALQAQSKKHESERQELLSKIEVSAEEIDTLKSLKLENESHLQTIAALEGRLSELGHKLVGHQSELKELNSKLATKMLKNPGELSAQERIKQDRLEREKIRDLAGNYWEGSRAPASATKPDWQEIVSKWCAQNPNEFSYDAKNNSILILASKSDLFKKASSELEERTQRLLKRLDLFIKGQLAHELDKFTKLEIIGHASPSYRGQAIEPRFAPKSAQQFNQKLSYERAQSAREYLTRLSPKLSMIARGAGFYNPMDRTPATASEDVCGKYDCALSRRLEVKFHLK